MTEPTKKTAALHNLGCKVNAYETEAMRRMLARAGYAIVSFDRPADVYVVNTCTVTHTADGKSRQMLHRARRMNPDAIVVAVGCYAQMEPEKTAADPAVDIVIGSNEKERLVEMIAAYEAARQPQVCVSDMNTLHPAYEALSVDAPAQHTRAFVKVQDGCDRFCSYCVIPYARGRSRSRAPEDVLREVEGLASRGYREIVLTGIHLSSYGSDRETSLLELIRAVHAVEGVRRIRLGSLEPGIITEEFVRDLVALSKVCPHFHLSLQSGSDAVLTRMNRHYTAAEYREKCELLRRAYEHPAITTDVIVGFPGETEAEFMDTCAFARRAGFFRIHVFPYSRREGTAAADLPDPISRGEKETRAGKLRAIADELQADFLDWYEGRPVEVLFEEARTVDGVTYYEGFTPEYVRVRIPSDEDLRNQFRTVTYHR